MYRSVFCSRTSCGCTSIVELTGGLKELNQEVAEGDLVQRLGEDGLADFLDHALERVRVSPFGNPAGLQVQTRHLPVVPG